MEINGSTTRVPWLDYNTPECKWYFDERPCSGNGFLASIKLLKNNLQGSLVPELGLPRTLEKVELAENPGLVGTLPTNIGSLRQLSDLIIAFLGIQGPLPTEIGSAASLQQVAFKGNEMLDGTLPSELGRLVQLSGLVLTGNDISGLIPSELCQLSMMIDLRLKDMALEGAVPSELGLLTNLENLSLRENEELVGTLATELASLTRLQQADLSITGLTGTIPFCSDQLSVLIAETDLVGC